MPTDGHSGWCFKLWAIMLHTFGVQLGLIIIVLEPKSLIRRLLDPLGYTSGLTPSAPTLQTQCFAWLQPEGSFDLDWVAVKELKLFTIILKPFHVLYIPIMNSNLVKSKTLTAYQLQSQLPKRLVAAIECDACDF